MIQSIRHFKGVNSKRPEHKAGKVDLERDKVKQSKTSPDIHAQCLLFLHSAVAIIFYSGS